MKRYLAAGALAITLFGVQSVPASATAITVDSGWHAFSFGDAGSSWDQDFTFTLTKAATLKVTDAFLSGDQFSVFNTISLFGFPLVLPLGGTSTPALGGNVGSNYDAAYADPIFSHAAFQLGAGTYDISGTVVQSPFGGGGAAIELVSTVPLPASAPMFGAALLALAGFGYGMNRWVAPKSKKAVAA